MTVARRGWARHGSAWQGEGNLASIGAREWSCEDTRRVVVQRAGINRTRPAVRAGWRTVFEFLVLTPEYIASRR